MKGAAKGGDIGRAAGWSGALLVARREWRAALDGNVAPAVLVVALFASIAPFVHGFFLSGRAELSSFFAPLPWLMAAWLPAVSMRLWSEDLRARTVETWRALPYSRAQLVLGKWLSGAWLLALQLLLTTPLVGLVAVHGDLHATQVLGGYAGALLLGAWMLALGAWISSTTADQTTAYVQTALLVAVFMTLGEPRAWTILDGFAPELLPGTFAARHLSPRLAYEALVGGLFGLDALVLFVGQAALWLWLNARALARDGR
jgi:ABC-2 type transport system permease protein